MYNKETVDEWAERIDCKAVPAPPESWGEDPEVDFFSLMYNISVVVVSNASNTDIRHAESAHRLEVHVLHAPSEALFLPLEMEQFFREYGGMGLLLGQHS